MTGTQYVGACNPICGRDVSITFHRARDTSKKYFFANGTASLQGGYISVTPNVCEEGVGISLANDSPDQNRRLRCPRASKHSQPSASSQSSQHVAASKKKKLLLLSQLSKSQPTTNTNIIFAGRASRFAPQNSIGLSAQSARAAILFPDSDAFPLIRARAARSYVRMARGMHHGFRTEVTPC